MVALGFLYLALIVISPQLRRSMQHRTSKTKLWTAKSKKCQSSGELYSTCACHMWLLCMKSSSPYLELSTCCNEDFASGSPHSVDTGPQNLWRPLGATGWCHDRPKFKSENGSPGGPLSCPHSHFASTSKINAAQDLKKTLLWSGKSKKCQNSGELYSTSAYHICFLCMESGSP
jgi:hypothetical protein